MKCVRLGALILLLFLGTGGIVGGVHLIVHPYENQWGVMPLSLLQYSPFHSYLVPGIILLVSMGLLPLWIYLRLKRRQPLYGMWTAFQGGVLFGWLTVECLMLRVVVWPHLLYAAIAVALIVLGFLLSRHSEPGPAHGNATRKTIMARIMRSA
jgi:hypothetical protein